MLFNKLSSLELQQIQSQFCEVRSISNHHAFFDFKAVCKTDSRYIESMISAATSWAVSKSNHLPFKAKKTINQHYLTCMTTFAFMGCFPTQTSSSLHASVTSKIKSVASSLHSVSPNQYCRKNAWMCTGAFDEINDENTKNSKKELINIVIEIELK